eukprot:4876549-Prymnesium_polylepis.2
MLSPSATAVEWLTSNSTSMPHPDQQAWLALSPEPMQQVVEVVSSYGHAGVDVGQELRQIIADALGSQRTVKQPRLVSYLQAYQCYGHFRVEELYARKENDQSDTIVRFRVYGVRISVNPVLLGRDKAWAQLNVDEAEAAGLLGYQQHSWDMGLAPMTCTFPWCQLSTFEQGAANVLGYTQGSWDAELAASVAHDQCVKGANASQPADVPAWKATIAERIHEVQAERSSTPSSSSNVEAALEAIDGLPTLMKGMSATAKDAAVEWCNAMDIPSVELFVQAELETEFVAQLGVKQGGLQQQMLMKRLATVAAAVC